jgi:hypothetical protein
MKPFKAIAAMSENRVIGCGGQIPWHLPEDFRFFRKMTLGNILVMGRRTFQAVGRPLAGRHTIVLSRRFKSRVKFSPSPNWACFHAGRLRSSPGWRKLIMPGTRATFSSAAADRSMPRRCRFAPIFS